MKEQNFITNAKLKHGEKYDYSKTIFTSAKEKIIIICVLHGEFLQRPSDHISGNGCQSCGIESRKQKRTKTTKQFIADAKLKHGETYDYSKVDYVNSKEKIIIICKKHGEYKQLQTVHLRGSGCKKCSTEYTHLLQKSNTVDFIQKAKIIHGETYDYSKVDYVNAKEKIIIICKIHGEFKQSPNAFLAGHVCSKCSGTYHYTSEEWIKKAREIHGETYDYSKVDYINCETYIKIICKKHGEFVQRPSTHLKGCGCIKCSNTYNYTSEEWIKKAREIHGETYDYSKVDYINKYTNVKIICKEHGYFYQIPRVHLYGWGCSKCSSKHQYTTEEWIKKAKIIHGETYDYSKVNYVNAKEKIIIICKIHGEFVKKPTEHIGSFQTGCPTCSFSHYSKNSIVYLKFISKYYGLNIQHAENIMEYKIPTTKYSADGYCQETNTIYEFHGDYWHGNPIIHLENTINKTNKKSFGFLYKKTLEREEVIKNLGYNLIVMWEYDWNKINMSIKALQKKFRNMYK